MIWKLAHYTFSPLLIMFENLYEKLFKIDLRRIDQFLLYIVYIFPYDPKF